MGDCFCYLENLIFKLLILNKFLYSLNIVGTLYLMSRNVDFLMILKPEKQKPLFMFSRLAFYIWVIMTTICSLINVVRYLWTFKQQITLRMVFLKHNSVKSDIFFNPIFIPCYAAWRFFRVHVFQGPGFSGTVSRF